MRLDKYLANMGAGTRAQVKKLIGSGAVTVDGSVVKTAKYQVDENSAVVSLNGKLVHYLPDVYLLLNKPAGYISSTERGTVPTVLDCLPAAYRHYAIFPVGRLDKDTTGLLLLTNDGQLAHALLSPRRHVAKTYRVDCAAALTAQQIRRLENGVVIAGGYQTKPAEALQIAERQINLTIYEGKYHQVKQMLAAVGNRVVSLERIAFAGIALDEALPRGAVRQLSSDELRHLKSLG